MAEESPDRAAVLAAVGPMLDRIKRVCFVPGYKASDAQAAGMMLSKLFAWDGTRIMAASAYALEDANFHPEAAAMFKAAGIEG